MGRADGVEARLFQHPHPPPDALVEGGGPENAVIVVDAAAPEEGPAAVDEKALGAVGNGPDAEGDRLGIGFLPHPAGYPGGIKLRALLAPEACPGKGDGHIRPFRRGDDLLPVKDFD